jgi:hypothetical protein
MVDRGSAVDEVATPPRRTGAIRQVLVEEETGRGPGQVVGRHDDVPCSQPVAVVLGGSKVLVHDVDRVTPTDQVVDILIEEPTQ